MLASKPPSDAVTHANEALASRLRQELRGRLRGVRVEVGEKGVILKGRVHTYYAKQIAQHLVMQMTELPIVTNDIEVP